MPQQKSKRILFYIFLFLIIGTFNNKYLNEIKFVKLNKIIVEGLDKKDNLQMIDNMSYLKIYSLFLLGDEEIRKIIDKNTLVEKYSVFKNYPSTLNIKVEKTKFLAQLKINGKNYLLGSNRKLTKTKKLKENLPLIFGEFDKKNFFELKSSIDKSSFDFNQIKNLFFFKSGRWDIETKDGLLIKLPKEELISSLRLLEKFLLANKEKKIYKIDLRLRNQIIINE